MIAAARAVASMVDDDDRLLGRVLPPMSKLHTVAKTVALAVARSAYDAKIATALPKPTDLKETIEKHIYDPSYASFA
jgi:malic enzyme